VSAYRLLSLLLQYPDAALLAGGAELQDELERLPAGEARSAIAAFLSTYDRVPVGELQSEYVQTFDFDRRASLYLTYHTHGDRRQRGIELVRLKRRFAEAELLLADGELPDYLPALLEFAALAPDGAGAALRLCWPSCVRRSSSSAAGCTARAAATPTCSTPSSRSCRR
jgi:nitrate reductase molybdenum cofactor assembly chaperone NarJ/NarW